jgi:preprotein translocase SecE subunit
MKRFTDYITASYAELRKVVWPSRKQAIQLTAAVIFGAFFIGLYLTLFGFLYQSILQKLLFKS